MAKLQKWEKTELLSIYKRERTDERCKIVKTLKQRAKKLTVELTKNIKKLEQEQSVLEDERTSILKKNNLLNFTGPSRNYPACSELERPTELKNFDKETDIGIKQIIIGDLEKIT